MATAPPGQSPSRRPESLVIVTLILIGLYPVAIVFGASAVVESIDPWAFARITTGSIAFTALLYGLLGFVIQDSRARLQWLAATLLALGTYSIVVNSLRLLGWGVTPADPLTAWIYVAIVVAAATVLVQPWKHVRRDVVTAFLISLALVGTNAYRAVARWWDSPAPKWIAAADALAFAPLADQHVASGPTQDIYYILLDEMGRPDVLQNMYGLQTSEFVQSLRSLGFYVADQAHSNYPHTVLSLSSFLNLDYLDGITAAVGRRFESHAPTDYLIEHNAVMRLAREAGYRVFAIGTDVAPTNRYDEADVCVCTQYGLSIFEQAVVAKTPLAASPLDELTYLAHRGKVLDALDTLGHVPSSEKRQFVFAHILAPHPPFTFAPDGAFRRPPWPFMFNDGSDFPGTPAQYIAGYRDQAAFVLSRVERIVREILNRPGPKPIIVIQGDHGPGSQMVATDAARTNMNERMSILAAYYVPGGEDHFYPTMTPVNANRILANRFLGTDLPRIPDASYFSTIDRPFDFVRVLADPR